MVDLVQSLSHTSLGKDLAWLGLRDWSPVVRPKAHSPSKPASSARRWGSLGEAVVAVLAAAATDLRMIDVHVEVERLLEERVSRSSVKNSLARRCEGDGAPLERVGKGRYRLRS